MTQSGSSLVATGDMLPAPIIPPMDTAQDAKVVPQAEVPSPPPEGQSVATVGVACPQCRSSDDVMVWKTRRFIGRIERTRVCRRCGAHFRSVEKRVG